MVNDWLLQAAVSYNQRSKEFRDDYAAILLMPVGTLSMIIDWTFKSLPDEILVGIDPDLELPHPVDVDEEFTGTDFQPGLFAGQGYVMGKPHLVNRGDSFSVHHVPEEWIDDSFAEDRGSRGGGSLIGSIRILMQWQFQAGPTPKQPNGQKVVI